MRGFVSDTKQQCAIAGPNSSQAFVRLLNRSVCSWMLRKSSIRLD
jgi:hypothetical protein